MVLICYHSIATESKMLHLAFSTWQQKQCADNSSSASDLFLAGGAEELVLPVSTFERKIPPIITRKDKFIHNLINKTKKHDSIFIFLSSLSFLFPLIK